MSIASKQSNLHINHMSQTTLLSIYYTRSAGCHKHFGGKSLSSKVHISEELCETRKKIGQGISGGCGLAEKQSNNRAFCYE